jgi:hypothetical protein
VPQLPASAQKPSRHAVAEDQLRHPNASAMHVWMEPPVQLVAPTLGQRLSHEPHDVVPVQKPDGQRELGPQSRQPSASATQVRW